jgi:hypothetical protein
MSLGVNKLQTMKVYDPRTKLNSKRTWLIYQGGQTVTVKDFTTTSYSNTNIIFSAPPPNPSIIVSRELYIQYTVQFTITGTAQVGQPLLNAQCDGLRAFPLSSVTSSLIITLNTSAVTINMSDFIQALLRINTFQKDREFAYSTCPSMMDQSQSYEEMFEYIRNPLGSYGDCYEMARGGFPWISLSNPLGLGPDTPVIATVSYLVTEPIFLSPFISPNAPEMAGYIGLQTMDFNWNFNNLGNMWSHSNAGGSILTSVVGNFIAPPTLLFTYITPKELYPIDRTSVYAYWEIQRYPTTFGAMAPGATQTIQSQNIQLQTIPSQLVLFARRQNLDQNFNTTDTFFRINSVQINFNNQSNLLASATELDLYNIARSNDISLSWEQWHGTTNIFNNTTNGGTISSVGSVLPIKFGKDLGLDDLSCSGLLQTSQLQINVSITNTHPTETITPTFYIVVITPGTFTISNNRSLLEVGVVSRQDVLDSKDAPVVDYHMAKNIYGGDFLDDLSRFGSTFWEGLKTIVSDVGRAIPGALDIASKNIPKALALKSQLGLGDGGCDDGGDLYGDGVVGGRMISRRHLRKRY